MFRLILCALLLSSPAKCEEKPNPSVIIVGAGVSGIAAATKLLKNGFTNIKILEAENRIGGRVNSIYFGDALVDMGAEWCHGENGNPAWEYVKDLDVVIHIDFQPFFFYSNGKRINDTIGKDLINFLEEVDSWKDGSIGYNCSNVVSVGECANTQYNKEILSKYKDNAEKAKVVENCLRWVELAELSGESAPSWKDVRLKQDLDDIEGDHALNWNGNGYRTYLDILMEKYPNKPGVPIIDKFELNKEVEKVIYGNNATVKTKDGSIYEANYVIITTSVGVLKKKADDIFEPKLPEEKLEAIRGIGFGCAAKIILHFPNKWWETEEGKDVTFMLVWNPDENDKIKKECPECLTKDGKIWIADLLVAATHIKNHQVLTVWAAGELVPEIEKLSDDAVRNGTMFALKKYFGQTYKVIDPDQMLRTSWCMNSHFYGTWSYDSIADPENTKNFRKTLSKSLTGTDGTPVVLFAGEASDSGQFGTVGGATRSGLREAQRIIDLHRS